MKRYEGMFVFDSGALREWEAIEQEVHRLCNRIEAELLACVKFDERKLAFEINRRKRGTFVLTYFEAPPERIGDLERDVQLSETVLRVLVTRAERISEERLTELKTWPAGTPLSPQANERRHDGYDRHDRHDRHDRPRRGRDGDDDSRNRDSDSDDGGDDSRRDDARSAAPVGRGPSQDDDN